MAGSTGIFLDPTYTGKAALGMVKEIKRNPSRFKGNRILFLHTGLSKDILSSIIEVIKIMAIGIIINKGFIVTILFLVFIEKAYLLLNLGVYFYF